MKRKENYSTSVVPFSGVTHSLGQPSILQAALMQSNPKPLAQQRGYVGSVISSVGSASQHLSPGQQYRVQNQTVTNNNNDYKNFSNTSQISGRSTSLQHTPQQLQLPLYNPSGYFNQSDDQIHLQLSNSGQSTRNLCATGGVQLSSDYLPNVDFMGHSHGHHQQDRPLQSGPSQHSTLLQSNHTGYNHMSSVGRERDLSHQPQHHHPHHLGHSHHPAISATSADSAGLLAGLDGGFVVKEFHISEW